LENGGFPSSEQPQRVECCTTGSDDAEEVSGEVRFVSRADLETAELLYQSNLKGAGVERLDLMMLTKLVERLDLPVEQIRETVETFYINSPEGSDERLLATSAMLTLLSHADKSEIKDDMYEMLRSMVPQFHKLALVETH
jgi:hypothetical protein